MKVKKKNFIQPFSDFKNSLNIKIFIHEKKKKNQFSGRGGKGGGGKGGGKGGKCKGMMMMAMGCAKMKMMGKSCRIYF